MQEFSFVCSIKENHNSKLYSVQIYKPYEIDFNKIYFATVGKNRCSVYEYRTESKEVDLVDNYMDADENEDFYTCAWTTDKNTHLPLLVVGGLKGVIRTIVAFKGQYKNVLMGHGSSIHDLKFHPRKSFILLSASKDYTLRLWNVNTAVCIAIFGGAEGHGNEVLSGDFNLTGTRIISCGMDHYLKMWNINTDKIEKALVDSETYTSKTKSFPTVLANFPDFSTRDVHKNYIDCVRWFGNLVLSKSCENEIILWKPGLLEEDIDKIPRTSKNLTIYHKFEVKDCDIWYVRFGMDYSQKILAVGTSPGKIYVWDLDVEDPDKIKRMIITHAKSKRLIRSIALTMNGKHLIAVNDDGCVLIWRR